MNLLKRLLAASGAAGLLVGLGATPALAAQFSASIAASCINSGAQQTINVESALDALVHIEVTIGGSTANGGTANGTGVIPANGSFSDQWTVGSVTTATTAGVQIWVLTSEGVLQEAHRVLEALVGRPALVQADRQGDVGEQQIELAQQARV